MKPHVAVLFGLSLAAQAWAGQVHLNHVTDTPPRSTMILTGSGFDPKSVRVLIWAPGRRVHERDQIKPEVDSLVGRYAGRPAEPPLTPPPEARVLTPYYVTPTSVFCRLPSALDKTMPPGYLAVVWLRDGQAVSRPWVINQPRLWFLLKDKVRPGEMNRVYGLNLVGDYYVENRLFIREPRSGKVVEPPRLERNHEDGVERLHLVQFQTPPDLAPGTYEVFVHNNSGREFGFTNALKMQVVVGPEFPEQLFDVTRFGARGDSVSDAAVGIQAALDKAREAGGGIVFVPPGSYRLGRTIEVPAHTILRGAGRHATTLFFRPGDKPSGRQPPWMISCRGISHTGIEDLTLRTGPGVTYAVSYYHGGKPTRDNHVLRCRIEGNLSAHYEIDFRLGWCEFDGVCHFTNLDHGWIHDCQFTRGRLRGNPVAIWGSRHCTIEHNRVFNSSRGFVWQIHGELGHYRNFIDANVVEDDRLGSNAGETFLFEGAGFKWHGRITAGRPDGLTLGPSDWKPNELAGHYAVLVSGPGVGQYRFIASSEGGTLRLSEPWRTVPNAGDYVTVMRGVVENILTNNRDVDCDNSMMFYGCGALGNRIMHYRSENGLGLTFWPFMDRRQPGGPVEVFVPDGFNIVDNCVFEDQGAIWFHTMGTAEPDRDDPRRLSLGQIVRHSLLTDTRRKRENQYSMVWESQAHYRPVQAAVMFREGWRVESQTRRPFYFDCLVEKNFIARTARGVEVTERAAGTVLSENVFFDVREPILDQGVATFLQDNRIEQHQPAGAATRP